MTCVLLASHCVKDFTCLTTFNLELIIKNLWIETEFLYLKSLETFNSMC